MNISKVFNLLLSQRVFFFPVFSVGAAEMLAMEMKASGMYVSRGLSFRQTEVKRHIYRETKCNQVYCKK